MCATRSSGYGDAPKDNFTTLSNAMVRGRDVNNDAFRVYAILCSHADGYETSASAIAEALGIKRQTVSGYLDDLHESHWIAVQRVLTSKGTRAYEVYHVSISGQFSQRLWRELSAPIRLSTRTDGAHVPQEYTSENSTGSMYETGTGDMYEIGTSKNTNGEHQVRKPKGQGRLDKKVSDGPTVSKRASVNPSPKKPELELGLENFGVDQTQTFNRFDYENEKLQQRIDRNVADGYER